VDKGNPGGLSPEKAIFTMILKILFGRHERGLTTQLDKLVIRGGKDSAWIFGSGGIKEQDFWYGRRLLREHFSKVSKPGKKEPKQWCRTSK